MVLRHSPLLMGRPVRIKATARTLVRWRSHDRGVERSSRRSWRLGSAVAVTRSAASLSAASLVSRRARKRVVLRASACLSSSARCQTFVSWYFGFLAILEASLARQSPCRRAVGMTGSAASRHAGAVSGFARFYLAPNPIDDPPAIGPLGIGYVLWHLMQPSGCECRDLRWIDSRVNHVALQG